MTRETIELLIDGKSVIAPAGATVASVLVNTGVSAFRTSVHGEARAPLCGMGICHECRVTINGVAHQRSCLIVVDRGMRVETAESR